MATTVQIPWARIVRQAVIAGIAGAILIDAFLYVATLLPQHASIVAMWQFIASTAFGKVAYTSTSYAFVGAAMHLVISMCWAGAYAFMAATRPFMNERWFVSGVVYGLVVYLLMQLILVADNNFVFPPNPNAFIFAVLAHTVFFGIPVAYIVKATR